MIAKPGWSRRWHPVLDAARFVGTGVLFAGCLAEIFVAIVIAFVVLNP